MISWLVLNHLKGVGFVMRGRYPAPSLASSYLSLTEPLASLLRLSSRGLHKREVRRDFHMACVLLTAMAFVRKGLRRIYNTSVSLIWGNNVQKAITEQLGETSMSSRVAIVTGASEGIGLACALALVKSGCRVSLLGRNETKMSAALDRFTADERTRAHPVLGDVTSVTFAPGLSTRRWTDLARSTSW